MDFGQNSHLSQYRKAPRGYRSIHYDFRTSAMQAAAAIQERSSLLDTLITEVAEARTRLVDTVRNLNSALYDYKPDLSQWSVNEVLEHLVLSEQYGVSRLWSWEGSRLHRDGIHEFRGLSIEEVISKTWAEKEIAPAILTPRLHGPTDYWVRCLQCCHPILVALGTRLQNVDLEGIVLSHFTWGPLDAKQRLQFMRFHIDHHIGQIRRIAGVEPSHDDTSTQQG